MFSEFNLEDLENSSKKLENLLNDCRNKIDEL